MLALTRSKEFKVLNWLQSHKKELNETPHSYPEMIARLLQDTDIAVSKASLRKLIKDAELKIVSKRQPWGLNGTRNPSTQERLNSIVVVLDCHLDRLNDLEKRLGKLEELLG